LVFFIGNQDIVVVLFILQTLNFIFLNHIIPAWSGFICAFFGWKSRLPECLHRFRGANFDL